MIIESCIVMFVLAMMRFWVPEIIFLQMFCLNKFFFTFYISAVIPLPACSFDLTEIGVCVVIASNGFPVPLFLLLSEQSEP